MSKPFGYVHRNTEYDKTAEHLKVTNDKQKIKDRDEFQYVKFIVVPIYKPYVLFVLSKLRQKKQNQRFLTSFGLPGVRLFFRRQFAIGRVERQSILPFR